MTTNSKIGYIKEQLEEVQARILENKKLQEEYPEQKTGLLIALSTLEHLESDMVDALKDEYVANNKEVYETHITGKNVDDRSIPIQDLGEFLIKEQTAVTAFGSKNPLGKNATIPQEVISNTQLNLTATAGGSLRIILTTPQKILYDVDNAESTVKHAFNEIQKLIQCGNDTNLLKAEETRLGSKKITAYKKLLETLYEKDLNMEISTRTSSKKDLPIFTIEKKDAKNVYNALIKKERSSRDHIEMTGVLEAVDFGKNDRFFKINTKIENRKRKVRVFFKEDLDEDVLKHMRKLSKVKLNRVTNKKGVGEKDFMKYHLINFEDD